MLREFMTLFFGNELVAGIVLANWLLLTGAGALSGRILCRKDNFFSGSAFLLVLAALPPFMVLAPGYLRNIFFEPGTLVSLFGVFYFSFLLLLPYCLLSGSLFTWFSKWNSELSGSSKIASTYFLDVAGSVAGGLLFSLVFIHWLDHLAIAVIVLMVSAIGSLFIPGRLILKIIFIPIVTIGLSIFILFSGCRNAGVHKIYSNQLILEQEENPYGRIVVTESSGQLNFYENGLPVFSSGNITDREEAVHYAMLQHKGPENVLTVSGGICGIIPEIFKYSSVKKVDYAELDPSLVELGRKYGLLRDTAGLNIITGDARSLIRKTKNRYDIILVNLPEPYSAQLNRFYTLEFFTEIRRILNPCGIISLSLAPSSDYISGEEGNLNTVLYNTMNRVFPHVLVVPGGRNYFLGSDTMLTLDYSQKSTASTIENIYVNPYYIDDNILKDRNRFIMNSVKKGEKLNTDFSPVGYFMHMRVWLQQFGISPVYIALSLGLILLVLLLFMKPVDMGLLTGGFAASSSEFVLLLALQIFCGFMYQYTALLFAVFMLGLAAGSLWYRKLVPVISFGSFIRLQFLLGLYCCGLPFILLLLHLPGISNAVIYPIILLLTLIVSVLTGIQFALASVLRQPALSADRSPWLSTASYIYFADLAGSALGLLAMSVFLVPLLGIVKAMVLAGILNLVGGGICWVRRNKR
jgi:spermidine synthase